MNWYFLVVDVIEARQLPLKKLKLMQSQFNNYAVDRKAKCVEQIHPVTGQKLRVYPCVRAAANFMGIDNSNINCCCNGKLQTCGGFKWRFYDGPPLDCKYLQHAVLYYINNVITMYVDLGTAF